MFVCVLPGNEKEFSNQLSFMIQWLRLMKIKPQAMMTSSLGHLVSLLVSSSRWNGYSLFDKIFTLNSETLFEPYGWSFSYFFQKFKYYPSNKIQDYYLKYLSSEVFNKEHEVEIITLLPSVDPVICSTMKKDDSKFNFNDTSETLKTSERKHIHASTVSESIKILQNSLPRDVSPIEMEGVSIDYYSKSNLNKTPLTYFSDEITKNKSFTVLYYKTKDNNDEINLLSDNIKTFEGDFHESIEFIENIFNAETKVIIEITSKHESILDIYKFDNNLLLQEVMAASQKGFNVKVTWECEPLGSLFD